MTYYLWYSDQTSKNAQNIIDQEGGGLPISDYFGRPLRHPASVALTDDGKLVKYTAMTKDEKPSSLSTDSADLKLVAHSTKVTVLMTHEGITNEGWDYIQKNNIHGAGEADFGRALIRLAESGPENSNNNNFKPPRPPSPYPGF